MVQRTIIKKTFTIATLILKKVQFKILIKKRQVKDILHRVP